jgi:hypothetical protein
MSSSCSKKERHEKRWLTALCRAARMSAVAGDFGQPASVFAGLAAIATIFLPGTSAGRMRAFVRILRAHPFLSSDKKSRIVRKTRVFQTTLPATGWTAYPMSCVVTCEKYCMSAKTLVLTSSETNTGTYVLKGFSALN